MKSALSHMRHYLSRKDYHAQIEEAMHPETDIVICMPAYKEDNLMASVKSVVEACKKSGKNAELIIGINDSKDDSVAVRQASDKQYRRIKAYHRDIFGDALCIRPMRMRYESRKKGGVGRSRQAVMDEALIRLLSINKSNVPLLNFDADATCDVNLICRVLMAFEMHPKLDILAIYFEHDLQHINANAIAAYECHLRYIKQGMQYTGYPWMHHTVGSAMATKASSYAKYGGMNTRLAGEDFHYFHKIARHGHAGDLISSTIYPSARTSDRVPFGTGRAMMTWPTLDDYVTYPFDTWLLIRDHIAYVTSWLRDRRDLPLWSDLEEGPIKRCIDELKWNKSVEQLISNVGDQGLHHHQIFDLITPLWMVQFANYYQRHEASPESMVSACTALLKALGQNDNEVSAINKLLMIMRNLDRLSISSILC